MPLTNAPSSLKIAEEPMWSDGTIFRLQRRRRNVSEERSFLWNFQPIRDEYSQPSPGSRLCGENRINQPAHVLEKSSASSKNVCFRFVHLLAPHLNSSLLIRYLLPWSHQPLPAMDVVHFLCCNPGLGFIIRGNCDSIFPAYC